MKATLLFLAVLAVLLAVSAGVKSWYGGYYPYHYYGKSWYSPYYYPYYYGKSPYYYWPYYYGKYWW